MSKRRTLSQTAEDYLVALGKAHARIDNPAAKKELLGMARELRSVRRLGYDLDRMFRNHNIKIRAQGGQPTDMERNLSWLYWTKEHYDRQKTKRKSWEIARFDLEDESGVSSGRIASRVKSAKKAIRGPLNNPFARHIPPPDVLESSSAERAARKKKRPSDTQSARKKR
jgi:hypothetical protein